MDNYSKHGQETIRIGDRPAVAITFTGRDGKREVATLYEDDVREAARRLGLHMETHTPGPWQTFREPTRDGIVWWIRDADGKIVDKNADAWLIKAAPDMLEALKAVRDYQDLPSPKGKASVKLAKKVVMAICKAEGKEFHEPVLGPDGTFGARITEP